MVCLSALASCSTASTAGSGSSGDGAAKSTATASSRSGKSGPGADKSGRSGADHGTRNLDRLPHVGAEMGGRIPAAARQVVVVEGAGEDSARSTVALYEKHGATWDRARAWPAHNGKRGWSTDHREGDKRSPVGVFTLSDAGGVLADPGSRLPYTRSSAFTASRSWPKTHWHDFDLVIAIDYNRVKGTSPNDPNRPQGQSKGGYIWLHMDHGSGTSGCVSVSRSAMEYLLRRLDPERHPVIVMGDQGHLRAG
ncbi:L,D-transpeptidase family protein [Streptomyces sp. YC537]|uniref:L,D-transpeptidase family protein n=2 Tax=Streptomyces boluensis TaxID=1775135 RepID=A0A964UPP2_9ACTN|nr:L,D-transpeptidase family protein [Streptomyces boluensis]